MASWRLCGQQIPILPFHFTTGTWDDDKTLNLLEALFSMVGMIQ